MDEINISELLDYYKERILLMITIVLTVLVLGCVYSFFFKTPLYKSTSTIAIIEKSGEGTITQSDVQLSKSLVTTYTQIIKSRKVAEKVINNLKLDYSVQTLINNITVENKGYFNYRDFSNEDLRNELTKNNISILEDEILTFGNIYVIGRKDRQDKTRKSIQELKQNAGDAYRKKKLFSCPIIGIVLALVTVFIIFYFDTTIKSAEEIESKFNLPVIGIVPAVKRKEK